MKPRIVLCRDLGHLVHEPPARANRLAGTHHVEHPIGQHLGLAGQQLAVGRAHLGGRARDDQERLALRPGQQTVGHAID